HYDFDRQRPRDFDHAARLHRRYARGRDLRRPGGAEMSVVQRSGFTIQTAPGSAAGSMALCTSPAHLLARSPARLPPSGSPSSPSRGARPAAFTLLEVILALAILAGAVAAIGELVRVGLHNADVARQLTRAEMLCESISDQIAGGAIAATS